MPTHIAKASAQSAPTFRPPEPSPRGAHFGYILLRRRHERDSSGWQRKPARQAAEFLASFDKAMLAVGFDILHGV